MFLLANVVILLFSAIALSCYASSVKTHWSWEDNYFKVILSVL